MEAAREGRRRGRADAGREENGGGFAVDHVGNTGRSYENIITVSKN